MLMLDGFGIPKKVGLILFLVNIAQKNLYLFLKIFDSWRIRNSSKASGIKELLEGKSVYHNISREILQSWFKLPLITPEEGAKNLLNISKEPDLTIFEYFMTGPDTLEN